MLHRGSRILFITLYMITSYEQCVLRRTNEVSYESRFSTKPADFAFLLFAAYRLTEVPIRPKQESFHGHS